MQDVSERVRQLHFPGLSGEEVGTSAKAGMMASDTALSPWLQSDTDDLECNRLAFEVSRAG